MNTREEFAEADIELTAKAPPLPGRKGKFKLDDFKVARSKRSAKCPAGKRSIRRDRVTEPKGWRYVFSRRDCEACPLREQCTAARNGARTITVTENTAKLQRLRRQQKTSAFRNRYRKRVIVEHRIARLIQLGMRQARYFGRRKVAFQVTIMGAVANLVLAGAKGAYGAFGRLFDHLWRVFAFATLRTTELVVLATSNLSLFAEARNIAFSSQDPASRPAL